MIHICVVLVSFVSPAGVALSGGQQGRTHPIASAPTEYQEESTVDAARALLNRPFEREQLKGQLLRVCAACNRGFGASALDRASVDSILERLTRLSPTADPTAGVAGSTTGPWVGRGFEQRDVTNAEDPATRPLNGNWRLVYTNATDVLSLDANPHARHAQSATTPAALGWALGTDRGALAAWVPEEEGRQRCFAACPKPLISPRMTTQARRSRPDLAGDIAARQGGQRHRALPAPGVAPAAGGAAHGDEAPREHARARALGDARRPYF